MTRAETWGVAALVFVLASVGTALVAFMILAGRPTSAQGDMVGPCFTAWEVLVGEPPTDVGDGQKPRTDWPQPCRAAAHEMWLRARPWTVAAGASVVASLCMWSGRRRSLRREEQVLASAGERKPEVT